VGLLDLGSFSRTLRTSKCFELPNFLTPQIRVRIAQAVDTEGHLFIGKQIATLSPATHIKLDATVLISFRCFSLLPSHLLLPSPFTAPWLTPLSMTPLLLLPRRYFFKKMTVTEDDLRAYHDRGWLTGNLVSFIPEVDVPTIEDSTILCFESQLAVGLGFPPNEFLSSIMNYLGCSLVHLNANVVSALSSFVMLCECLLEIPPDTILFWYYYSPARYTKTIFGGINLFL
jgi:hypothetical protein